MFFQYGVTILAIFLGNVGAEDASDKQNDFPNVIRDIPTLFQLIVDMLHERPEVLEKDDITTFMETPGNNGINQLLSLLSPENDMSVAKRETVTDFNFDDSTIHGADLSRILKYDWYPRKVDDFEEFLGHGVPGTSQLTADEVSEMMLMVETKLEEYYNETK